MPIFTPSGIIGKGLSGGGGPSPLVGWWKFDDGSGSTALDSSPKGNNGTISGTPNWVTGHIGGAMQFDGSNYVAISTPTDFNFDTANPFSISTWVLGGSYGVILSKYENFTGYQLHTASFDFAQFGLSYFDGSTVFKLTIFTGFGQIPSSGWNHICTTYDGSGTVAGAKIYINGTDKTVTLDDGIAGKSILTTAPFWIGKTWFGEPNISGPMDDMRIYNRVLTGGEIATLAAM